LARVYGLNQTLDGKKLKWAITGRSETRLRAVKDN